MPFCPSLSKVLRDEQIELVTHTKVPGWFAWGQGVLYELGLGAGEVSGLFTKIRMNLSIDWTKEVRQSRLFSKTVRRLTWFLINRSVAFIHPLNGMGPPALHG
jgi:hypothetical protein